MKSIRIAFFAFFCAISVFAQGVPDGRSFYWGGRFSLLFGSAWNDEPVKGVFSPSQSNVEESKLVKNADLGLELGALGWFRLNRFIGLEAEANFRIVGVTLENRVYNRPLDGNVDDLYDASLMVYGFDFPLLFRVTPVPFLYFEAGAQFNLNLAGSISDFDEEDYAFDMETLGWALAFGGGALSHVASSNLLWSAGFRAAIDMTRIESEGIVEIREGGAYREASPMKFWNFQVNAAFYF